VAAGVCSEFPACQGIGDILKGYAPSIGVEYGGTVSLAIDAPDATAQCLQLVNSGAEMVVTFLIFAPTSKLATTCKAQGFKGDFAIYSNSEANYSKLPSPNYGVLGDFPWWSDAKPVAEYRAVMKQYAPSIDYKGYHQTDMWALLQLFNYAITNKGPAADANVGPSDVTTAYQTGVKDVTLDGLLPQPITYTDAGGTTINCFWPIKYSSGNKYENLAASGKSGNGATGDLATTCIDG